jgi:3-hydroxyisobutyrate dehydrogenase-like beta-hydroxyacid dehydrogenase
VRVREPVTVLGLGPMGQALAGAFLAAGHPTTIWNRTAARGDALVASGAVRAGTAPAAVAAGPLVVACLLNDEAVHEVLDPVAAGLAGRALVNLTSSTPAESRRTAAWAAGLGAGYLDGAILTPTPTIGQPSARVLYSGDEAVHQAHRATLASLGGTAGYLGADPGRAAAYDMVLLDIFWSSVLGLVHGLALAGAEGIAGADVAPYAGAIAGMLPEMAARFADQVAEGRYPGERSTLASAASSLDHLAHAAEAHRIDSGALVAFRAMVRRALDAGHGDDGLARLVETLQA